MPQIITAIDIDAPAERVWEVLTDTAHYEEWNPLVTHFRGSLEKGKKFKARFHFEDREFDFDARLEEVDPEKGITWCGPTFRPLRALVSARHFFEIKDLGNGKSRFFHGERLRGLIFDMESVWAKAGPRMEPVYEAFNEALKARAEAAA